MEMLFMAIIYTVLQAVMPFRERNGKQGLISASETEGKWFSLTIVIQLISYVSGICNSQMTRIQLL